MALFPEFDPFKKHHTNHEVQKPETEVEISDITIEDALEYFGLATKIADRATEYQEFKTKVAQLDHPDFSSVLEVLIQSVSPSPYRDMLIETLMQEHFTDWSDLGEAEQALSTNTNGKSELVEQLKKVNAKLGFIPLLLFAFLKKGGKNASIESTVTSFFDSLGVSIEIEDATSVMEELQQKDGTLALLEHLSDEEILMALQDLLLGPYGLLKDQTFELYGQGLLKYLFSVVEKETTDPFFKKNKETLISTIFLALRGLSVERRAAVLLEILRSFQRHSDSELVWQHIAVDVLMQFVSGTKLLQMDVFLPEEFKLLAMAAKENMPPTSKLYVRDVLDQSGRKAEYTGIGPCRAAASTATVHPLAVAEDAQDEYRVVSKTIHEHAEEHLEEEFKAFGVAIRYFVAQIGSEVNVEAVLSELQTLVFRELDPSIESGNTKRLRQIREEHGDGWVQVPEVVFASDKHIEMSMAPGFSLQSLLEGNVPDEYKNINWKQVCFLIVRDYFKQVFEFGIFNADEHAGNVFVHLRTAMSKLLKSKLPTEVPPVTVIDHGSVGTVDSSERRRALFLFGLGFELQDEAVIAEAMVHLLWGLEEFQDADSRQEEITQQLRTMPGTLFENAMEILVTSGKGQDVLLFSKGLAAIFPLIEELSVVDKFKIAMPYVRKLKIESEVLKNSKGLSRSVLKNTLLGLRSRFKKEE